MRKFVHYPVHPRHADSLFISINDLTVPYMTACVDLEDPFLNHSTNGLNMYVISQPIHVLC